MSNRYDLAGAWALVTGSTKGIGLATAQILSQSGCRVVITARDATQCARVASELPGAVALPCDLADDKARAAFCDAVDQACGGKLDFIVHNAGYYPQGDIVAQTPAEFREVQIVNVESAYDITRRLLPALKRSGRASIVFVSSVVTRMGRGDSPAYTTSKAAQIGLTQHLAAELGPSGIRVNCVLPGLVDTPGTRFYRDSDASYEQFAREQQMLPLIMRGHDIAHPIVFLLSDASRAITAATIDVNAGLRVGG